MPRIASVTSKQLTVADPFQTKERVVARLGSLAAATYAVAGAANNIDEGSALTINITTANIRNGGVLRWRIIDRPTDFSASTGTVVITSNAGSFTVTPTEDLLLEGPETFRIQLEKLTGTVIATSAAVTINDTSATILTVTPDETTVDEGDTVTFTVNLISGTYLPGTPLYWTASSSQDFVVSSGSFTLSGGTATFSATLQLDLTEEGIETVTVSLRATSIEGAVLATSDPITVNDTSVPTYAISSNFSAVNEGSPLVFFVTTTGIANGTTLYWTVSRPEDFFAGSGSFTINSNSGSFGVAPLSDATTEGPETFTASVRTGSVDGTVRVTSSTVTINDTSLTPTYSVSTDVNSVNEGSILTFNVTTANVANGTTLYWTVTQASQFYQSSGSFVVSSNAGSFTVEPIVDLTTDGAVSFTASIRTDSVSGSVVATSGSVTMNDTSKTPAALATLTRPNLSAADANAEYGFAVAMNDEYFVVSATGASGTGQVHQYDVDTRTLIRTYNGSESSERYGFSVAMNSTHVFISPSYGRIFSGFSAEVHGYNLATGNKDFTISNADGNLACNDDYLVIGYPWTSPDRDGEIRLHDLNNSASLVWTRSNPNLDGGSLSFQQFGFQVSIDDQNRILVACGGADPNGISNAGLVYFYDIDGNRLIDPIAGTNAGEFISARLWINDTVIVRGTVSVGVSTNVGYVRAYGYDGANTVNNVLWTANPSIPIYASDNYASSGIAWNRKFIALPAGNPAGVYMRMDIRDIATGNLVATINDPDPTNLGTGSPRQNYFAHGGITPFAMNDKYIIIGAYQADPSNISQSGVAYVYKFID
jgi:hypothetical protein